MEPPKAPTTEQIAQVLSSDLQAHFRNASVAFLALDLNRSGKLEASEIQRTLQVYNIPGDRVEEVFAALDKDGSGSIDYAEFCQLFFGTIAHDAFANISQTTGGAPRTTLAGEDSREGMTEDDATAAAATQSELAALSASLNQHFSTAAKAFLKLDTNRSGRISVDAIRELEQQYNLPTTHLDQIMQELDVDADGTLSYEEMAKKLFYYSANARTDIDSTATQVSASVTQEDNNLLATRAAIAAMSTTLNQQFSNAAEAFLKLDEGKTGRVTLKDLELFEKQHNLPITQASSVFDAIDANHDGTLDFNEVAQRLFYLTGNQNTQ